MLQRFRQHRRGTLAILLLLVVPASAFAAPGPVSSAIIVAAVAPARPVLAADHRVHLAYELLVVNPSGLVVTLESIATLDGVSGAILAETDGEGLAATWISRGEGPPGTLAPGQSAFLVMDVALPEDADPPRMVRHRVQTSRALPGKGGEGDEKQAQKRESRAAPTATFVGGEVAVERVPAIVLAPPLHGAGWLVTNGCCDAANPHRATLRALDGHMTVPERFAIDFVQLQSDGRLFSGPLEALSSYQYFALPVVAATDGVVVGLADDQPDVVPGGEPEGKTPESALGNYVVVATGAGRYVLYAHLKAGSVGHRIGEPVKTGDAIGLLGNSGETSRPHLHFEVMDSPSPLAANGLPYVFRRFAGLGRLRDGEVAALLFKGEAALIDKTALPGNHRNELPLDREVVEFE